MRYLILLFITLTMTTASVADDVSYTFEIKETTINKTGKSVIALSIEGQIPGPTIKARVGDMLTVTFHNRMLVETSIHWHGVLLPHDQDGVPWLNTVPIAPQSSHTFTFPVTHAGTYWYHSHTGLQEQRGVYGSIIFEDPTEKRDYDQDLILVFSDWTDERPEDVIRNLKRDGDYYAVQKDSVQSWDKVIANGSTAIKQRLKGAWTRMGPMDLSDVAYDAFLANGEEVLNLGHAMPGDRIRVRMINAAASSYFNVEFAGGPMTIIAADGMDIEPLKVKRLNMAIAETWDAIIEIPESGNFEIRATATDGTGYASAFIGMGKKIYAPDISRPNLFVKGHDGHDMGKMPPTSKPRTDMDYEMDDTEMASSAAMGHDMDDEMMPEMSGIDHDMSDKMMPKMLADEVVVEYLSDYSKLRAPIPTNYDPSLPTRTVNLSLTGNMERYIWSFNNKTLSESDRILIKKGEVVRFVFDNKTMMNHPLHLHGHFFRVLYEQGDYSPLKHTVNVPSMGQVVIEFAANDEADWFFHCHNLYHMKAGMTRVISYEGSSKADKKLINKLSTDNHWYTFADVGLYSNVSEGKLWSVNNRYQVEFEWMARSRNHFELEASVEVFKTRYLDLYVGVDHEKEADTGLPGGYEVKTRAMLGAKYILPMLVEADVELDHKGHVTFGLSSDLQLTKKAKLFWDWNSDNEFDTMLEYAISKKLSLAVHHNNRFGTGAGLLLKF